LHNHLFSREIHRGQLGLSRHTKPLGSLDMGRESKKEEGGRRDRDAPKFEAPKGGSRRNRRGAAVST